MNNLPSKEAGSAAGSMAGAVQSRLSKGLSGTVQVPGDKSMSHRALILGALAEGKTRIRGLLQGDDVLRTAACLRAMGVSIERRDGVFHVIGRRWQPSDRGLYCGNAGTGVRLLMGAVAGQQIAASFDGDASLRARPMGRILAPLRKMGLCAEDQDGKLPVSLEASPLKGIVWEMQNASAQVKSAIMLAALGAEGETIIEEPVRSRDHTERMIKAFGGALTISATGEGGRRISLTGPQRLTATDITIPGDPSSAAFLLVAALLTKGSEITVQNVLLNPLRTGFLEALKEMGADLSLGNEHDAGGEPVGDITARFSELKAIHIGPERAASMIDEYPILAVAAAFTKGTSRFEGLAELRLKESDRLAAIADGLAGNGVTRRLGEDWLEIDGGAVSGGGEVATHMDHRIAMSFLVMGLATKLPVTIDSSAMIATSFPGFIALMQGLGAKLTQES